jgi:hypothetical protein
MACLVGQVGLDAVGPEEWMAPPTYTVPSYIESPMPSAVAADDHVPRCIMNPDIAD